MKQLENILISEQDELVFRVYALEEEKEKLWEKWALNSIKYFPVMN